MAKTPIRRVPRELSHSDIYLDDLFEIEQVFVDAFAKLPDQQDVSFEYVVGNERMTTRQDLMDHGGHTSFSLQVVAGKHWRRTNQVLGYHSILRPSLEIPFELADSAWPIYAQVDQILRGRTGKLESLVNALPEGVLPSIAGVLIGIALFIPASIVYVIKHASNPVPPLLLFAYILIATLFFVFYKVVRRQDRVYLRFRRDEEKQKDASRKQWIEKLVILMLGAILGVLGAIVTNRFKNPH